MMRPCTEKLMTRPFTGVVLLFSLLFLSVCGECFGRGEALAAKSPFSFESVVHEAKKLSEKPYKAPKGEVPDRLLAINYDQWRDIRFKPDKSFWRKEGLPFTLQFFHP